MDNIESVNAAAKQFSQDEWWTKETSKPKLRSLLEIQDQDNVTDRAGSDIGPEAFLPNSFSDSSHSV